MDDLEPGCQGHVDRGGRRTRHELQVEGGPSLHRVDDPARRATKAHRVDRKEFGMSAIHVFRLDARDGGTVVHTEESFEGWLARLLRGQMRKTLQNSLDSGLRHLKTRVQRPGG